MKAKKAKDIKVSALQCAAGAVTGHNAELSSHLKRGVAIFTETPPISERLRCETNGAHKYIEDFATALKALPRGCPPVKRTMGKMRDSCRELILGLKETERLLPDSVPEADRRAFLDCIALVSDEELGFYNLVTGESGAEPDYHHFLYCKRINNSVNSIKKRFTKLNIAIQHIERDLRSAEVRPIPSEQEPPRRYPTRKSLTVPMAARLTGLSESTIKRLDRDPRNTNYPGRNSTPEMLAAWARLYREGKFAAQTVRAANRPLLGSRRT